MINPPNIRLAIQKSGRLADETFALLSKAGFKIPRSGRNLRLQVQNFPMEILLLRTSDIPEVIADGAADLGVVGENIMLESQVKQLKKVKQLHFGDCRLSIAVPRSSAIKQIKDLRQTRIATSHVKILKKFLKKEGIEARIITMNGSVEIAPSLKIADAICDIVHSGSTLKANAMQELVSILDSEAVLVGATDFLAQPHAAYSELLLRLDSVVAAQYVKSVVLNAPEDKLDKIVEVLPGIESPTITPLRKKGWVAVHSVVTEDEHFWQRIIDLKKHGANGILVHPLDRVIY
jgi:ATP phosphoribosyltransferase